MLRHFTTTKTYISRKINFIATKEKNEHASDLAKQSKFLRYFQD